MSAFRSANSTAPAHGAVPIVANDSTNLPATRAVYVGTSGDLTVRMADGMTVLFANVPVGIFSIQVDRVLSTGTTAADLVALY